MLKASNCSRHFLILIVHGGYSIQWNHVWSIKKNVHFKQSSSRIYMQQTRFLWCHLYKNPVGLFSSLLRSLVRLPGYNSAWIHTAFLTVHASTCTRCTVHCSSPTLHLRLRQSAGDLNLTPPPHPAGRKPGKECRSPPPSTPNPCSPPPLVYPQERSWAEFKRNFLWVKDYDLKGMYHEHRFEGTPGRWKGGCIRLKLD